MITFIPRLTFSHVWDKCINTKQSNQYNSKHYQSALETQTVKRRGAGTMVWACFISNQYLSFTGSVKLFAPHRNILAAVAGTFV